MKQPNNQRTSELERADIPSQRLLPHQKLYITMAVAVLLLFSLVSIQKMHDGFGENFAGFVAAGQAITVTQDDLNAEFEFQRPGSNLRAGSVIRYGGKSYTFRNGKWNIPETPAPRPPAQRQAARAPAQPAASPPVSSPQTGSSAPVLSPLVIDGKRFMVDAEGKLYNEEGTSSSDTFPPLLTLLNNLKDTNSQAYIAAVQQARGESTAPARVTAPPPAGTVPPSAPAAGHPSTPRQRFDAAQQEYLTAAHEATQASKRIAELNGRLRAAEEKLANNQVPANLDALNSLKAEYARLMPELTTQKQQTMARLEQAEAGRTAAEQAIRGGAAPAQAVASAAAPPPQAAAPAPSQRLTPGGTTNAERDGATYVGTYSGKDVFMNNEGHFVHADTSAVTDPTIGGAAARSPVYAAFREQQRTAAPAAQQPSAAAPSTASAPAAPAVAEETSHQQANRLANAYADLMSQCPAGDMLCQRGHYDAAKNTCATPQCKTDFDKFIGKSIPPPVDLNALAERQRIEYEESRRIADDALTAVLGTGGAPVPAPDAVAPVAAAPAQAPPAPPSEAPPRVPAEQRTVEHKGYLYDQKLGWVYVTVENGRVKAYDKDGRPKPVPADINIGQRLQVRDRGFEDANTFSTALNACRDDTCVRQVTQQLFTNNPCINEGTCSAEFNRRYAELVTPEMNTRVQQAVAANEAEAQARAAAAAAPPVPPTPAPVADEGPTYEFSETEAKEAMLPPSVPSNSQQLGESGFYLTPRNTIVSASGDEVRTVVAAQLRSAYASQIGGAAADQLPAVAGVPAGGALPVPGSAADAPTGPLPPRPVTVPTADTLLPEARVAVNTKKTQFANLNLAQLQSVAQSTEPTIRQAAVELLAERAASTAQAAQAGAAAPSASAPAAPAPVPGVASAPTPAVPAGAAAPAAPPTSTAPDLAVLAAAREARIAAHKTTFGNLDERVLASIAANTATDPEQREAAAALLAQRGQTPPPVRQTFIPPAQAPQPIRSADEAITRANEVLTFCAGSGYDAETCKKVADYSCVNNPACTSLVQNNLQPLASAQAQAASTPVPAGAPPAEAPPAAPGAAPAAGAPSPSTAPAPPPAPPSAPSVPAASVIPGLVTAQPEQKSAPPTTIDQLKSQLNVECKDTKCTVKAQEDGKEVEKEVTVSGNEIVMPDGTTHALHEGGGVETRSGGNIVSFIDKNGKDRYFTGLGVKEVETENGELKSLTIDLPQECHFAGLLCGGGETKATPQADGTFKLEDGGTMRLVKGGLAEVKNTDGSVSLIAPGPTGGIALTTIPATLPPDKITTADDGTITIKRDDGTVQTIKKDGTTFKVTDKDKDGKVSRTSSVTPAGVETSTFDHEKGTMERTVDGMRVGFGVGCTAAGTCASEGALRNSRGQPCTHIAPGVDCGVAKSDGTLVSIEEFCKSKPNKQKCMDDVESSVAQEATIQNIMNTLQSGVAMANDIKGFCNLVSDSADCDHLLGDWLFSPEYFQGLKRDNPVLGALMTGDWEESACWSFMDMDRSNAEPGQEGFLYDIDGQMKLWVMAEKAPVRIPTEEGGLRDQQGFFYRVNGEVSPSKLCKLVSPPGDGVSKSERESYYKNKFITFSFQLRGRSGDSTIDPDKNPETPNYFRLRCDEGGISLVSQQTIVRYLEHDYSQICVKFHELGDLSDLIKGELNGGYFCNTILPSQPEISSGSKPSGGSAGAGIRGSESVRPEIVN